MQQILYIKLFLKQLKYIENQCLVGSAAACFAHQPLVNPWSSPSKPSQGYLLCILTYNICTKFKINIYTVTLNIKTKNNDISHLVVTKEISWEGQALYAINFKKNNEINFKILFIPVVPRIYLNHSFIRLYKKKIVMINIYISFFWQTM